MMDESKQDEPAGGARSDSDGLSAALKAAAASDQGSVTDTTSKAIAKALNDRQAPVFSTYSDGFLATCAAEEMRLKDAVADIDAQIAGLNAQRTNAMLAFSMVQAARLAREKGLSQ